MRRRRQGGMAARSHASGVLPSLRPAATASCLRFRGPYVCRPSPRLIFASRMDKRVPPEGTKARNPRITASETVPGTVPDTVFPRSEPAREALRVRQPGPETSQAVVRGDFSGPSATRTSLKSLQGRTCGRRESPLARRPIAANDPGIRNGVRQSSRNGV